MFGNQDSYGLFTTFYSVVIKLLGVNMAAVSFSFFMQLAWVVAVILLMGKICAKLNVRVLTLPLLICFLLLTADGMPFTNVKFFSVVENFTCSRMLSLDLAMYGLYFLLCKRKWVSLCFFLVGTAIHPITAGWCLPIWMFLYYPMLRMPVCIVSLLVPLTCFLHKGPFDIYPDRWGMCAQRHDVTIEMIVRETVGVVFFGLILLKNTNKIQIKSISKSIFIVMSIALYWTATGGLGKHIFLYQVQTWRIEWLMWIFVFPFYAGIFAHKICSLVKTRILLKDDFVFFLSGPILFFPNYELGLLLLVVLLCFSRNKEIDFSYVAKVFCFISVYTIILQTWIDLELCSGVAFLCKIMGFESLWGNISFLVFLEGSFGILFLIVALRKNGLTKKSLVAIALVVAFIIHPQWLVLPIVVFGLFIRYPGKKIIMIAAMCFVVAIDSFFDNGLRESNCFSILFVNYKRWFFMALFSIVLFILPALPIFNKGKGFVVINAVIVFLMVGHAFANYDCREKELADAEKGIDQFLKNPPFEQVKDRGKMLYYVDGAMKIDTRTQFLTGAYFDKATHIGEPLFEKQFELAKKRDNLLFYKADIDSISPKGTYDKFVKEKMSNPDTLLDRTVFLCGINEITHLVTSTPGMPLPLQDSVKLKNGQEVFLYGCR